MSVAYVYPQPDGTAVCELDGMARPFPSSWAAIAEARRMGLECRVDRFPSPSMAAVTVLASTLPGS